MLFNFFNKIKKSYLLGGSLITFFIRVSGITITMLLHLILARLLTPDDYGKYIYIINIVLVLSVICSLGFPTCVLRFTPQYYATNNFGALIGLIKKSIHIVLIFSLCLVLITYIAFFSGISFGSSIQDVVLFAIMIVPLISCNQVQLEVLRGLKKVVLYNIPEVIILPTALMCSAIFLYYWFNITYQNMIKMYLVIELAVVFFTWLMIKRVLPFQATRVEPVYYTKEWLTVSAHMLFSGMMQQILNKTDILMLGSMCSMKSVGIYNVALKLTALNVLVLRAIRIISAPLIAEYYAKEEMEKLQRLLIRSSRYILMGSLPFCLPLMIWPSFFMGLFGSEFQEGSYVLLLLMIGQMINVFTGILGSLLTMTGHQKKFMQIVTTSSILNVVLNFAVIPHYGMEGAALVTSTTMILWNLWMYIYIRKVFKLKLGFWTSITNINKRV